MCIKIDARSMIDCPDCNQRLVCSDSDCNDPIRVKTEEMIKKEEEERVNYQKVTTSESYLNSIEHKRHMESIKESRRWERD